MVYTKGKKIFINPGSCGLPMDSCERGAPYTLIEADEKGIRIEERRIPYNMDEFIKNSKKVINIKKFLSGVIFVFGNCRPEESIYIFPEIC